MKYINERKKNEIMKILEENKITNFYTPEDQIKLELKKQIERLKNQNMIRPFTSKEEKILWDGLKEETTDE